MIETIRRTPPLESSLIKNKVIKAILYFDVFSYPLKADELFWLGEENSSRAIFDEVLDDLTAANLVKKEGPFYFSPFADTACLQKRKQGNIQAAIMIPTAIKWSKIIYSFPFVRSVNLSGSLSKNYYDSKSDIDYFIITKKNRLWICRTLLSLYWRLLSKTNKKYFCTNYFVDETVLEIGEQNQFTAIELSHLIPVINGKATARLMDSNKWLKDFIAKKTLDRNIEIGGTENLFKRILEKILDNCFGDLLDDLLLRRTASHWRKKFPGMVAADFELQFRTRKSAGKRHTQGYQNKVLKNWEEKQKEFESQFNLSLR